VGGPRTTAALTPIADVVEVKLPGFATTGKGSLHTRSLHGVTLDDVAARVEEIRSIRPDAQIGLFLTVGCGNEPVVRALRDRLEGAFAASLFGDPAEVARTLSLLAGLGIVRLTLAAVTPGTYEQLAGHLGDVRAR
jgi:hypothetical protein